MPTTTHRPVFVTFLTVIGVIQGLVVMGLGLFLVLDRNDNKLLEQINDSNALENHQLTSNHLLTLGIAGLALGAILVGLAVLLSRGSNIVRWLVVVVSAANVAVGLHSLVALDGEQRMSGSVAIVFGVLIIWLLVANDESKAFFGDGTEQPGHFPDTAAGSQEPLAQSR